MQVYFEDLDLEELIETGYNSKYKTYTRDRKFLKGLIKVYEILQATPVTKDLSQISYLHYERLKYINLSSVRILNNRVERLLFKETEEGICIVIIELDKTHYGTKK